MDLCPTGRRAQIAGREPLSRSFLATSLVSAPHDAATPRIEYGSLSPPLQATGSSSWSVELVSILRVAHLAS